ncbi:MAG: Mu-like prophage major head subunit gpT family protein [Chromatiaceae bacterium]|nr:Mu-like prophage major head subunit gpT family protein [Candidatus Thioaporhodococcus sediminis]
MSVQSLNSRAIISEFYAALEADTGQGWIDRVSMLFTSDQDSEEYRWIGQTPAMREWIGGRNAKGFQDNGLTIKNKHYEATLEVLARDLRRDKTGQVLTRIRELALRANAHWASLLSTLILNGASATCYDGQYFFDTDHSEGSSGSQSNSISVDISALAAAAHGSTTLPSVEEMQQSILSGVSAIANFKDDQGEPMNELASQFLVMVPPSLHFAALNAVAMPLGTGVTQQSALGGFNVQVVSNARLSTWTASFAVFRTDGMVKPFIRQQETEVQIKAKAEGSEFEFDNDMHQYGVDAWRNVGYGYWQHACLVTMT